MKMFLCKKIYENVYLHCYQEVHRQVLPIWAEIKQNKIVMEIKIKQKNNKLLIFFWKLDF